MRSAVRERHVHDAVPLRHQGMEEPPDQRITCVPTELAQVNHLIISLPLEKDMAPKTMQRSTLWDLSGTHEKRKV